MSAEPALEVLACPECGNDGRGGILRYAVDYVATSEVVAFRRSVLEIAGPPARSPGDSPMRPRVECGGLRDDGRICGHTFVLPSEVRGITWRLRS